MTERPDWSVWLDPDHAGFLPPVDHAARRGRLQAGVGDLAPHDHAAALLVTGAANVRWASGFTGSNGLLVVLPDRSVLVTDARYEGRAAVECPGLDVVIGRPIVDVALGLVADSGVDRLAFEGDHVSHRTGVQLRSDASAHGLADAIDVQGFVERERIVKDDAELARLARACAITEAVLAEVLERGLVGHSEREVADAVEDGIRARDTAVGFATIVAAGHNGAVPHHEPTTRVIRRGELVTIDCGARVDGYHADTTRTVAAGTLPDGADGELVTVFTLVAEAQQAGVEAAVVGAGGRDVDAACRDHIADAGLGDAFVHGTGHGVGLEIHEAPAVAATAAGTLADRTPLTVEPGVYLPGRGGVRIEDTVVVVPEGPARRLTNAPRTLLVV